MTFNKRVVVWFFIAIGLFACSSEKQAEVVVENSAQVFMNDFVRTLIEKDLARLPEFFPQQGVWVLQGTMGGPEMRSEHTRAEVREAIRLERGIFDALIHSEGDTLRDFVMDSAGAKPWKELKPGYFVSPGSTDDADGLFIQWREESGRWVIDVIGVPFA